MHTQITTMCTIKRLQVVNLEDLDQTDEEHLYSMKEAPSPLVAPVNKAITPMLRSPRTLPVAQDSVRSPIEGKIKLQLHTFLPMMS